MWMDPVVEAMILHIVSSRVMLYQEAPMTSRENLRT
jgi:hypothetical protein